MPILNPEHLLEQADRLVAAPAHGPPRQVDLRRAISAAYYGLFHFCLAEAADEFIGASLRTTSRYALFYRSINHSALKALCEEAQKTSPRPRYVPYFPVGGFDQHIRAFCTAAIELQEKRHLADYNPQPRFRTFDAKLAISAARNALDRFHAADADHRKAFLALLLCPPR